MITVYFPEGTRTRDNLESAYELIAEKGGTQVYRWYDEKKLVEDFFNDNDECMAQISHDSRDVPEYENLIENGTIVRPEIETKMSLFKTISHRGKR